MKSKQRILWRLNFFTLVVYCLLIGSSQTAAAATFTVNSPSDAVDANPGDGVCETATGNGVCTLRAAITEANQLVGADEIILPPGTYILTMQRLDITDSLTITGAGAATTIIDGNKSFRPADGVLTILSYYQKRNTLHKCIKKTE